MKTKQIPAMVMLSAGFVTCLIAIFQNMELMRFTKTLLIVLVVFYVLGCIIAYILNKNFSDTKKKEEPKEETEEAAEDETKADVENIEAEEKKN